MFGSITVNAVPIPEDCTDGFLCAYWKRPEMYFDPNARRAISSFSYVKNVEEQLARLRDDLASGAWARTNATLRGLIRAVPL